MYYFCFKFFFRNQLHNLHNVMYLIHYLVLLCTELMLPYISKCMLKFQNYCEGKIIFNFLCYISTKISIISIMPLNNSAPSLITSIMKYQNPLLLCFFFSLYFSPKPFITPTFDKTNCGNESSVYMLQDALHFKCNG